jgi:predicted CXXCH cytochrome family protein
MTKTLVAFALAFVASTASAAISGSAHDFISNGYMTTPPATTCTFCHVPHGGSTAVTGLPLWNTNRSLTAPTALYGTNATVDSKGTMTCLGCHATGAAADMGTDNSMPANGPTSQLIVGTDLSNDHPVGDATVLTLGAVGFQATVTLGGVAVPTNTAVQCSTCHDVHNANTQVGTKLLRSYTGDFCLACHDK